jgi:hypothetical protein
MAAPCAALLRGAAGRVMPAPRAARDFPLSREGAQSDFSH